MTAYRAIAGADIRKGMVVILKPGGTPFEVARVELSEVTQHFVYLYDADGQKATDGAIFANHWYAEVVS